MSLRARVRRVGAVLNRRGWLGADGGALVRTARALDRRLAQERGGPASVAEVWDGLASDDFVRELERYSWSGIPAVHANHNYLVTGDRAVYWIDWIRDRYFPQGQAGDVLSLGCGNGHLDRILLQKGFSM